MQLAKVRDKSGNTHVIRIDGDHAYPLSDNALSLADLLSSPNPKERAMELTAGALPLQLSELALLPPIDQQEVWAAGVTYIRSKVAREEESEGAALFYDKVYSADRPELFMKATPQRVVGPNGLIRVRADSQWSVPEPELTLMVSSDMRIVGYTIGNDVSSRDIEGENPLYLPQAKVYHGSCALGPVVTLPEAMPKLEEIEIQLSIHRNGQEAFAATTTCAKLNRKPDDLVEWLSRENRFPDGVILMTGTGIVPPDDFTLSIADRVEITIAGIGTLVNVVGD